jgi:hypothetical protein
MPRSQPTPKSEHRVAPHSVALISLDVLVATVGISLNPDVLGFLPLLVITRKARKIFSASCAYTGASNEPAYQSSSQKSIRIKPNSNLLSYLGIEFHFLYKAYKSNRISFELYELFIIYKD